MSSQPVSYIQSFAAGLGEFSGVFLGVLAGTAVTILVRLYLQRRDEKGQVRNLVFELELNCRKLETWLEELGKYRNAVNGDSLHTYFGYFKLSSTIGVTAFQLHTAGVLYKYLSHEHIGHMQEVFNDLSLPGENYLNNQIQQRKQALADMQRAGQANHWQQYLKPQIVRDIDFWEQKFKLHLNALRSVIEALKTRC